MIKTLHIKNYAIIEDLVIRFSDGLSIITGETGAGKSILLGALGLIMGRRADTKSLYDHAKKCVIEGTFKISPYNLQSFFEAHELDYDEETVVRREISPSGKTRAFINDTPVNLKQLQHLSGSLIDLHQQFDTLDIHEVSFQLRMLDALAGHKDVLKQYSLEYQSYENRRRELRKLEKQQAEAGKETDFLQFQLNELLEAELMPGEQEELEAEITTLTKSEDIKRVVSQAVNGFSGGEQNLLGQLEELQSTMMEVAEYNPKLQKIYDRYLASVEEISDINRELEDLSDHIEYDGERINEIQERLDHIYRLEKKHRVGNLEELLKIQADFQMQLGSFGDLSGSIAKIKEEITTLESGLQKLASRLSKGRKAVCATFLENIHDRLAQLKMHQARLKILIQDTAELTTTGMDDVQFLLAPNKGSDFLQIKEVASGGELSRLALVIKSLVASAIPLPTLIFDEIDTGVSGDVSQKMGKILKQLATDHQVISITHTPQIAAQADMHFFVYKQEKNERTVTQVQELSHEDRIREIATMLSGNPPSSSALQHADELLREAVELSS